MSKVTATIVSASVLTLFLVGLSSVPQLLAVTPTASNLDTAPTLNAVQLSIQTSNLTAVSSYDLVAYNSTGTPVASYTGQYPQVTLELPSGAYLFAATANGPEPSQSPVCCVCAQSGAGAAPPSSALKTNSGPSTSSDIAFPCFNGNAPTEYGYSLAQVTGPASLTIATEAPSSIPTADVSVSVTFKNGTAVSGADVSANIVGTDSSWGDNPNLSLYAQTASNGVAQLVVPAVPLTVTASDSVQVNLTQSQTTVQVNVGGQPVNVTLYYSPNYVYLSASALLLPPQTSLSMVLTAQTQSPPILYAAGSASSAASPNSSQEQPGAQGAAVATSNGASRAAAQIAAIPPIPASALVSQAKSPSNIPGVTLLAIGTIAVAGALAAVVGIAISRSKR
ncbi:MAG: hypothetical protein OK442_08920 [Thaumarchaeota archaeon]|nr:hypothetical protein [Nitrososphaerota archaeon]